ncbi:MAG: tetratricopeptide repeat protein [Candidatus Sifarchaeia archaeon]|jgi:hypothetical protein
MSAQDFFLQGNEYLQQELYEKAIQEYEKAVNVNPNHDEAWMLIGLSYNMIGEYRKGIKYCKKALKINPKLTKAWKFIAEANYYLNNYKRTVKAYIKVVELEPNNADGWICLGQTYFSLEQYKWAIHCYEKALKINPNVNYVKIYLEEALEKYPTYYKEKEVNKKQKSFDEKTNEMIEKAKDWLKKQKKSLEDVFKKDERRVCPKCKRLSPKTAKFCKHCGAQIPKLVKPSSATESISIKRGYDSVGQYLKIGIKVENNTSTTITDVTVKLDAPSALEKVNPTTGFIELGVIRPQGLQAANFQLRPTRCVDDIIHATIIYRDVKGESKLKEMRPLKIRSICPMLTDEGVDKEQIIMSLKKGEIQKNISSFKFRGDLKTAFIVAEARVRGLLQLDRDEQFFGNSYIASACYIGRTKYGKVDFATEITVCGKENEGLLTIAVYSEEDAILSGFFYEVLEDVRKSVEIFEERIKVVDEACVECGARLKKDKADAEGYLRCNSCETFLRLPSWDRGKN